MITTTWTRLTSSVLPGSLTLQVSHSVAEWNVGDQIIITSSSFLEL